MSLSSALRTANENGRRMASAEKAVELEKLTMRLGAATRVIRWACDSEDCDFFVRDHPEDHAGIALIQEIVLGIKP